MLTMKRFVFYGALVGALTLSVGPASADCGDDFKRSVKTSDGCFAIDFMQNVDPAGNPLVVFIHGDGGPIRRSIEAYREDYADQFSLLRNAGINVIVVLRPGHRLPDWSQTSGYPTTKNDNYTGGIIAGISEVMGRLRQHYKPSKMVLLGHSGGAMISGIIAGRHPGVADAAVLVAWGCNTREWRQWRIDSKGRRGQWHDSLSAHDFLDGIPKGMRVIAITGSDDSNTKPSFAKACTAQMKSLGLNIDMRQVDGFGHSGMFAASDVTDAVIEASK